MEPRHIPNDFKSPITLAEEPETLLRSCLQRILNKSPPQSNYASGQARGLYSGHTGIAYLFLHVYSDRPKLQIHGYPAIHWAHAYISGNRGHLHLEPGCCGIASERLCHAAVRACITKDLNDVRDFLDPIPHIIAPPSTRSRPDDQNSGGEEERIDPFPTDLFNGRSGTLYLLRMIRHWVPNSAPLVENYIVHLTERILSTDDDGHGNWLWRGGRYIGAADGDVGILTQLVLTTPPLAPRVQPRLERLLEYQLEDGNWPAEVPLENTPNEFPTHGKDERIQWCHGAPGFVISLLSLRPFFPDLQGRIDDAIEKARNLVWDRGLLRKEPSLCHGILGNALVFPPGSHREHFLALATPNRVAEARRVDSAVFQPAAYEKDSVLLMNYDHSAAWAWLICERQTPRLILFNDM